MRWMTPCKSYQEKFRKAAPFLEQVISEKPNDVQILELLGQVYANLGEAEKAKAVYDKAIENNSAIVIEKFFNEQNRMEIQSVMV